MQYEGIIASNHEIPTIKKIECISLVSILVAMIIVHTNLFLCTFALFLSFLLIRKPELLIPAIFVSALLSEDIFIVPGITASRVLTLLFIIAVLMKEVINKSRITLSYAGLLLVVYLVFITISAFCSSNGLSGAAITMMLNIILVISMEKNFGCVTLFNLEVMLIGGIEIILCLLYNYFTKATMTTFGTYALLGNTNTNLVGIAVAQIGALLFSFYLIYDSKSEIVKKNICLLSLLVAIGLLLLLASRSALIGLLIGIFIVLVLNAMYLGNIKLSRVLAIIIFSLIALYIMDYIFMHNSTIAARFSMEQIQQTGGTGRIEIWSVVWNEIIKTHPIFGVGFGGENIMKILYNNGIYHSGTHNIVLDIVAQLGIVGLAYTFFMFINYMRSLLVALKNTVLAFIPLTMILTAIANGIGENIHTERIMWFAVGIGLCMVKAYKKGNYE